MCRNYNLCTLWHRALFSLCLSLSVYVSHLLSSTYTSMQACVSPIVPPLLVQKILFLWK